MGTENYHPSLRPHRLLAHCLLLALLVSATTAIGTTAGTEQATDTDTSGATVITELSMEYTTDNFATTTEDTTAPVVNSTVAAELRTTDQSTAEQTTQAPESTEESKASTEMEATGLTTFELVQGASTHPTTERTSPPGTAEIASLSTVAASSGTTAGISALEGDSMAPSTIGETPVALAVTDMQSDMQSTEETSSEIDDDPTTPPEETTTDCTVTVSPNYCLNMSNSYTTADSNDTIIASCQSYYLSELERLYFDAIEALFATLPTCKDSSASISNSLIEVEIHSLLSTSLTVSISIEISFADVNTSLETISACGAEVSSCLNIHCSNLALTPLNAEGSCPELSSACPSESFAENCCSSGAVLESNRCTCVYPVNTYIL